MDVFIKMFIKDKANEICVWARRSVHNIFTAHIANKFDNKQINRESMRNWVHVRAKSWEIHDLSIEPA